MSRHNVASAFQNICICDPDPQKAFDMIAGLATKTTWCEGCKQQCPISSVWSQFVDFASHPAVLYYLRSFNVTIFPLLLLSDISYN